MKNNIKQIAKQKNLSINKIAIGIGRTRGYLSEIINHKHIPSVALARELADFLETNIDNLFPKE